MERYIIRQEYFGASIMDTIKSQFGFLEQRETEMLKMLKSESLDKSINRMIRSVDPSIANTVLNNMLSFIESQQISGVINKDNTLNYTIRQMSDIDLKNIPRESLKAPLKLNLNLNDDSSNTNEKQLSDSELYKIFQETRLADVLGLTINAKNGTGMKSYDAHRLSECAKNLGLITTINYDTPIVPSKSSLMKNFTENEKIVFDLDLENCVKELNLTSNGETSFYCPGSSKVISIGNIRSHNYSIIDLWDAYRDAASLCNSSQIVPQEIWRD